MSRITASGLALLHECGYSYRDDVSCPPEIRSDESARGTALAVLFEHAVNGGAAPAISDLVADLGDDEASRLVTMWRALSAWVEANRKLGWVSEQGFAWEPETDRGRALERRGHRDYSRCTSTEVAGTADLVIIVDDTVIVYDVKSHAPGAPELDATAQLEGLALFAARAYDYDRARIVTLNVSAERGVEPIEGEEINAFRLIEIGDRIRADVARIANSVPTVGPHCTGRYCKAIAVCPQQTTAMAQLVPDTALVRPEWRYQPVIESPDHLAHMLALRPLINKACKQVDAAITAYVAAGPVHTSDGREIKQSFKSMPRMNQGALTELARSKGATEDEISACVRSGLENNGVKIGKPEKAPTCPHCGNRHALTLSCDGSKK